MDGGSFDMFDFTIQLSDYFGEANHVSRKEDERGQYGIARFPVQSAAALWFLWGLFLVSLDEGETRRHR